VYGLENISANNGWAIAVLGAGIVFTGLAVLSLVISQIYRILQYFENRTQPPTPSEPEADTVRKPPATIPHLPEPKELVSIYRPLVEGLDEPFQLAQLYEKAAKMDLPHTHISISRLREAGVLASQGDGAFIWDQELANSM
jgi:hypothetical protein